MAKPTFSDVANLLIEDARRRVELGENSPFLLANYRQRFVACEPFLGATPIEHIDRRKLRDLRNWLADRRLKASSINPVMSFVSMALKLAEEEGWIAEAPAVPRARHKDSPRPAFTRETYQTLLETLKAVETGKIRLPDRGQSADWELRAMVSFMVNSFVRPNDLFVMRHRHVIVGMTDKREPYLRLHLPSSKGHTAPVITMPAAAKIYRRTVQRRPAKPQPDDFVFMPLRHNRTYARELVRRQFAAVLELAGIRRTPSGQTISLYSLRHSAITFRLLESDNLDLLTLARTCRTSVEMIDRFYASSLTADMNRSRLHSQRSRADR